MPALIAVLAALSLGSQSAGPLVITNATVIDVASGALTPGQTIVIQGNRITAVGPAATTSAPKGARVLDATGKFIIPGLWDMHVHASGRGVAEHYLSLLAANGITGVREMFGRVEWYAEARRLTRAGKLDSPRIIGAGHILDGTPPIWPGSVAVHSAEEARRAVDSLVRGGAAFIKVYQRLTAAELAAVADEAKKNGVPFAGHVPSLVLVSEASDLGIKSIEHLQQLTIACSSEEASLRAATAAAVASPRGWDSSGVLGRRQVTTILATFDPARCRALAERLKANGTWMVPTLTVLHSVAYLDDPVLARDARLRYIPKALSDYWNPAADFRFKALTPEDWTNRKKLFAEQQAIVRILHEAGVEFLAGTDLGNPYTFPGFSLHEELGNLVSLGFTPIEALRTATLAPARFFGATDSLGSVARGKLADLVVLDANPLEDIRNTQKIFAVVTDGRLIDAARRQALLKEGERLAGH